MTLKNKKHVIIEVILILIILIQAVAIYLLYDFSRNNFLKDGLKVIEYFSCAEKSKLLYENFENGHYKEFINFAEPLYKNGYEDKLLLSCLASASFFIGNERKAAEFLELSFKAGYKCKIVEPKYEETKQMEEAIRRYHLSEIYTLLGEKEKAAKEYEKAYNIAKRMYAGEPRPDVVALNFHKHFSIVEQRKKILSQKEKGP